MERARCAQQLLQRGHALLQCHSPLRKHQLVTAAAPAQRRSLQLLQHHHLKPATEPPFVLYGDAEALQEEHRARFLSWKAAAAASDTPNAQGAAIPRPQLLSFQSTPTYTLGRRQDELTPAQAERLTRPLTVSLSPVSGSRTDSDADTDDKARRRSRTSYTPQVKKTNRGGLTTYHGPGQLVFWPVLDMHSPLHARFGVASYARLLEDTTRRLLADMFAIETYTNPDEPGVWVARGEKGRRQEERKIAALGVHHRRYVTALGVALNVHLPVTGTDEEANPWARFVPCGLQGKLVTSVAAETGRGEDEVWDLEALAGEWAKRFEEGLLNSGRRAS